MDSGMHQAAPRAPSSSQIDASSRHHAHTAMVGRSPRTPEVPGSYHSYSSNSTPISTGFGRPAAATGPSPLQPRATVETPDLNRVSEATTLVNQPAGPFGYTSGTQARPPSPSGRYSGVFSSALPMSDSPRAQSPAEEGQNRPQPQFNVIFLAASVYEFNIDRARREAGYPYLTYGAGEVSLEIGQSPVLEMLANRDRSSTSLARKGSSGWRKTRMIETTKLVGSGTNISASWLHELLYLALRAPSV